MNDTKEKIKVFISELSEQAEKNNISLYAIKDRFLLSIKENISFADNKEISEETKKQYYDLVKANIKKPINEVLLSQKSRGSFDKTRSAYKFVVYDQINIMRSKMDDLRKEAKKNPEKKEFYYNQQQKIMDQVFNLCFRYKNEYIDKKTTYKKVRDLNNTIGIEEAKESKKYTMKKAASKNEVLEKMNKNKRLWARHSLRFSIISTFGCRPAELNNIYYYIEGDHIIAEIAGKKVNEVRGQKRRKIGILIDKEDISHQVIINNIKKGNKVLKSTPSDYNSLRKYILKNFENTSLYSYRHIVASKLKNILSDQELARFLGHRSTNSAKSYGNKRTGKNWLKPSEDYTAEASDPVVVKTKSCDHFKKEEVKKDHSMAKNLKNFLNKKP